VSVLAFCPTASDRAGRAAFHSRIQRTGALFVFRKKAAVATGIRLGTRRRGLMARVFKNRQTTLILALAATFLSSPMAAVHVYAHPLDGVGDGDGPTTPPPDGKGDPDVPTGPARKVTSGAQRVAVTPSREAMTASDGRVLTDGWVWRLRIVLRGLKLYT